MNAFVIDTFEFGRKKERAEGGLAVADFARLRDEVADDSGTVQWSLQGGMHASGHPQLQLAVKAEVRLMCQRCLMPFALPVESATVLVLAGSEEAADELEDQLADEDVDVIAGSKSMDVLELVEDEVLLSIPLSPKHEQCLDQLGLETETNVRVSPFDVLKKKQ